MTFLLVFAPIGFFSSAVALAAWLAYLKDGLAFELRFGVTKQHVIKVGTFPPGPKRTRKPRTTQ